MKSINVVLLVLFTAAASFFLSSCATNDANGYAEFKGKSAKEILADGEKELGKRNYITAAKRFEAIDALYPFADEAKQADLDVIFAYYKSDNIDEALAAADRFIHLYPEDKHTDYAYYMKGLINFDRGKSWSQKLHRSDEDQRNLQYLQEAFSDFDNVVQGFHNSVYAKDAYARMVYIRTLLAKHELSIADFYFKHKAYVAAANRASFVVKHYNGTEEAVAALKIMIKSYDILGAKQQKQDALGVLKHNYPNEKV